MYTVYGVADGFIESHLMRQFQTFQKVNVKNNNWQIVFDPGNTIFQQNLPT